jgi:hypothetical protein
LRAEKQRTGLLEIALLQPPASMALADDLAGYQQD